MSASSHFSILPLLDLIRHAGRKRREAPHLTLARRGEDLAHRFMEREMGWRVVARNYRHPLRKLEIDIVAVEGDTVVIIEVKTRSHEDAGAIRRIDNEKAWHIGTGAKEWIKKAEMLGMGVRFDAITATIGVRNHLEYHRDVCPAAGRRPV